METEISQIRSDSDAKKVILNHYRLSGTPKDEMGVCDGVVIGARPTEGLSDEPNGAYKFSKVGDRIIMKGDKSRVEWDRSGMSVSWWAKYPKLPTFYPHFFRYRCSGKFPGNNGVLFRAHGMGLEPYGQRDSYKTGLFWNDDWENGRTGFQLVSTNKPDFDVWNHYASTFDPKAKVTKFFINGNLEATTQLKAGPAGPHDKLQGMPGDLVVGQYIFDDDTREIAPQHAFHGSLCDLIVFKKAISDAEVQWLYDKRGEYSWCCEGTIVTNEELERIEELKKHSDISINLENKKLELWSPIFVHSKVKVEEEMKLDMSLEIDEEIILRIVLGKKLCGSNFEDLRDYYRFFEHFKMKREQEILERRMKRNLSRLDPIDRVSTFLRHIETHESGIMNLQDSHRHPTTFILLDFLREEEELYSSIVSQKLENKNEIEFLQKFFKTQKTKTEESEHSGLFHELFEQTKSKSEKCDLHLITESGKRHPCHLFMLLLRSNFFSRMMHFGGTEAEQVERERSIKLEELKDDEVEAILEYFYSQKMKKNVEFDLLMRIMIFADKYCETDLLSCVMSKTKNIVEFNITENSYLKQIQEERRVNCASRGRYRVVGRRKRTVLVRKEGMKKYLDELEEIVRKYGEWIELNVGLRERFLDVMSGLWKQRGEERRHGHYSGKVQVDLPTEVLKKEVFRGWICGGKVKRKKKKRKKSGYRSSEKDVRKGRK